MTRFDVKKRQQEVILVVNLPGLPNFEGVARAVHFVDTSLQTALGKFSRWAVIAALGVGLGIGGVIAAHPQPVVALPEIVVAPLEGVVPVEVTHSESQQRWLVTAGEWPKLSFTAVDITWLRTEGGLISTQNTVLLTNHSIIKTFVGFDRGQELMVLGENQGRYHFHLTDTKWISRSQLDQLISENQPGLIIVGPADWWGQEWIAVLAVPVL